MFQANINASLKNLETQVGQLALAMKNQPKMHSQVTQEKSKGLHGCNSKKWQRIRRWKS